MTLKLRLAGALCVLGLVLVAVVGTFFWSARGSEAALSTVLADRVTPLSDLKIVADSYAVQIVDSAHKARNGNISFAQAAQNVEAGRRDADAAWKRYLATEIDGDEARLADVAGQTIARARGRIETLDDILRSGDRAALDRFVVKDLYASIDPISDGISKLVALQITIATSVTTDALAGARIALTAVVGLALLALAVVGGSLFVVLRQVVRPIGALTDTMATLATGRYDVEVPGRDRGDELGAMARAVAVFRENGIAKNAADTAKAKADVEQKLVVDTLSNQLSELSRGDLTAQITVDFPGEYAGLKANFNEALDKLRTLIGAVSESATAIRTGSGEIAQASEDLARRTESNAASLEETAASVTQIDGRLKASATAASQTVERADRAISTVGGGRAVADEAVQAMGRVSDSAKGIDSVIEGLDKIAFQTRVLAMNAAVEAGRAGDAGRGFAVVADLVSALAMRAEEEAKRARDQLTVTQTDIVTAVEAVTKVDGALANISSDVGQVHELLATMAADNQAQSAAITQISAAIGTMDQATQQNAAMVEETSAAARNLAAEVTGLSDQAGRFVTGAAAGKPRKIAGSATPTSAPAAPTRALVSAGDDEWNAF